jgi:hypothetical protein
MSTKAKATTATATATKLSLAAYKSDTNVAEHKAIDALTLARLTLERGEQKQKELEAREAALLLTLAETKEALANVKREKSFVVFNQSIKRKAVEDANAHVFDALKVARQEGFRAGARGAGLFADMNVVRAMARRFGDDTEAEAEASPAGSPSYTPDHSPPSSPTAAAAGEYVPMTPRGASPWGRAASSSSDDEEC